MPNALHIDIETYSSVDIRSAGAYKYIESLDFEILLIAYAYDDEPVQIIDLASGEKIPIFFKKNLLDPAFKKYAHNAVFERLAFKAYGFDVPAEQWHCSAVKAAYCGLPLSLDMVSKALDLEHSKLSTGKNLIRYFCVPCKPTKVNGGRTRNFPEDAPEAWAEFKHYCLVDVAAEREIEERLQAYEIPAMDRQLYVLDQEINDRGILIDKTFVESCLSLDSTNSATLEARVKKLTSIDNPNSAAQLKQWLGNAMNEEITTLAKNEIPELIERSTSEVVREVLRLRQKTSKSSIKKYVTMLATLCDDGRAHGLFQFYGAMRTGRWAGRLIQLQNLPQNHLDILDQTRSIARRGDLESLDLLFDDISDTLSQLIRTAFVAPEGKTFAVADFRAIEARVIAWLAGEAWRLEVFNTHGKIYEASASAMFNIPIEEITKGSNLRQKGKIAELALGYQGGEGALRTMGGERMGLSSSEMVDIVKKWRKANPAIVKLWKGLDDAAKSAVRQKRKLIKSEYKGVAFLNDGNFLQIILPSGRKLFYCNPSLRTRTIKRANGDTFEAEVIIYWGKDQMSNSWVKLDTYGGKLAENIVQAIARDLLGFAMLRIKEIGKEIVMHVHDEIVVETDDLFTLDAMIEIMSTGPKWAKGLPLGADGYLTAYYKKD